MQWVRRLVSFSMKALPLAQCYAGREVILIDHDVEANRRIREVAMMKAKGVMTWAFQGQLSLKRKNIF